MSAAATAPAPPTVEAPAERVARPPIKAPKPTVFTYFWSVVLWVIGLVWIIPMMMTMLLLYQFLPTRWLNPLEQLYVWGQLRLLLIRWRAECHPAVDPKQPYVFMTTHINHLDHVTMYQGSPHIKQGLELREHFKYPVYGWYMKARGTIAVDRGRGGQSAEVMANFQTAIDKGESILAFPEGTRTTTGRVGKLRRGTFYIARELGIPVVPVAVTGMYEVMQKGSLLLRPFKTVTVIYDEPIPTAGLTEDDIPDLVQRVENILSDHVDAYWADNGLADGGTF